MGATILAYLLTGPVVFGLIGWGLGMALSLYIIWVRYGVERKS
jgi:hypothetical protein